MSAEVQIKNYEQRMLCIVPKRFGRGKVKRCPTCGFDLLVVPGKPEWKEIEPGLIPVRCPGHRPGCLFSAGEPPPVEGGRHG